MHSLLAHAYHFSLGHLALLAAWAPVLAACAVALALRLLGRGRAGLAASLAVLAGWALLDAPGLLVWPEPPLERLAGLGVLLAAATLAGGRVYVLPLLSLAAAWWLRGAPLTGAGVAHCVPVFFILLAALAVARRVARGDSGWATLGAAAALAGSLLVAHASPHWGRAALVPAAAALGLVALPGAVPALVTAIVLVAAQAVIASDRGRFVPVDAACAMPILVWLLAPRLQARMTRTGPALAGGVAAAGCIALAWAAAQLLR